MSAVRPHLPLLPRAAGIALLLLASACKPDAAEADAAAAAASQPMAVSVATASPRAMTQALTVSGPASPVEEMLLGVELSGLRVTALNVDVGERVQRGEVLLSLDHRMLDASLAQARAALREAEAGAQLARANLARGNDLAGDRFISAMQLDELRAARTQAEARLGTAQAAYDTAALQRNFADLRAPADGLISKRLVQPGQVVSAGMELLRLIRDGRLEWRAELSATQLARVRPGDAVRLTTDRGQVLEGRVRAVSPGVDAATRTGTVFADLPPGLIQSGALQAGAYLQGHIATGADTALAIPAAAVVLRDGFPTVFVVDAQSQVQQTQIATGARDGDFVQVNEGLESGARVVVDGAGFLADGDRVRVVSAAAAGASGKAVVAGTDAQP